MMDAAALLVARIFLVALYLFSMLSLFDGPEEQE